MSEKDKKNPNPQTDEEQDIPGAQDDDKDNGLPKTQEELDALIEKRLKRERKKMEKEQQKNPPATIPQQDNPPATIPQQDNPPATIPQQDNPPPPADTAATQENLMLKAQLSAIKDGVNPQYVEDAVYLALRDAEKNGEADEDGIKDALKEVLKRHPEWTAKGKKEEEKGGGFKVGASRDNAGGKKDGKPSFSGTVIL